MLGVSETRVTWLCLLIFSLVAHDPAFGFVFSPFLNIPWVLLVSPNLMSYTLFVLLILFTRFSDPFNLLFLTDVARTIIHYFLPLSLMK